MLDFGLAPLLETPEASPVLAIFPTIRGASSGAVGGVAPCGLSSVVDLQMLVLLM